MEPQTQRSPHRSQTATRGGRAGRREGSPRVTPVRRREGFRVRLELAGHGQLLRWTEKSGRGAPPPPRPSPQRLTGGEESGGNLAASSRLRPLPEARGRRGGRGELPPPSGDRYPTPEAPAAAHPGGDRGRLHAGGSHARLQPELAFPPRRGLPQAPSQPSPGRAHTPAEAQPRSREPLAPLVTPAALRA